MITHVTSSETNIKSSFSADTCPIDEKHSLFPLVDLTQDKVVETKIAISNVTPEKIDVDSIKVSSIVKVKKEPDVNNNKVSQINV